MTKHNVQFFDSPVLEALTKDYPVDDVLQATKETWASGIMTGLDAARFFGNSPAQNCEAEIEFGKLMVLGAREGGWKGYDLGWTPDTYRDFQAARETGSLNHYGRGLDAALREELVEITLEGEKVVLFPRENLLTLAQKRAGNYRG